MKCPVDNETLVMSERHGIEIDYCPKCRGVWLDRGELDKIIERSVTAEPRPAPAREPERRDEYQRQERPYKKKRESFLGELFDF
jgi:Zn-finger nucleic acid-binding protein